MEAVKRCGMCGASKPLGEFHRRTGASDGRQTRCKTCVRDADSVRPPRDPRVVKAYRERNRGRIRAASVARYRRNAAEARAGALSRYYANRERAARNNRRWRMANRARVALNFKAWAQENPAAVKALRQRRRARKLGAPGWYTAEQLEARVAFYGHRCAYCGGPFEHVDHVVPLSRGGSNWPANLRPACKACNLSKGKKRLSEWLR